MKNKIYIHRYIARIILKAETPLFVGSGESSLTTDSLVQKDIHGFPMIPGTSLAGVLRHALEDNSGEQNKWRNFFGYQEPKENQGVGSKVKISSAYLILNNEKIVEGLTISEEQTKLLKYFNNLPVRQHVKITHKGVADIKEKALFDNEIVYAGTRFIFEIELKGDKEDEELWNEFLKELYNPFFRIGQGTRGGYGRFAIESFKTRTFDLEDEKDFDDYLNFDNSLNSSLAGFNNFQPNYDKLAIKYQLQLIPESFFIFSAGYGDEEVDNIPVTEKKVVYENGMLKLSDKFYTLIPGSSIKGALRHRTAFHYNRLKQYFVDKYFDDKFLSFLETQNQAIYELFGAGEGEANREGRRGKVIVNDIFITDAKNDKIFNHVAIDRFTGGARDGALFSKKVSYFEDKKKTINITIYIENDEYSDGVIEAFEEALKDVCKGLLPLGGMTTKGHGIFTGKLSKNGKEVYNYEN